MWWIDGPLIRIVTAIPTNTWCLDSSAGSGSLLSSEVSIMIVTVSALGADGEETVAIVSGVVVEVVAVAAVVLVVPAVGGNNNVEIFFFSFKSRVVMTISW